MPKSVSQIFIDTSAFKAHFDNSDDFHNKAADYWKNIKIKEIHLITSNFILDETFTLIKSQMGKEATLLLKQDLQQSCEQINIIRITENDEKTPGNILKIFRAAEYLLQTALHSS